MADLPKHLLGLSKGDLESLCVNCGLCCYAQVELQKGTLAIVPDLRCRYLVGKGNGETCCSVYENRHEIGKGWCFPLADAIEKGLFPKNCPYVADMQGYVGTQVLSEEQYAQMKPLIKSVLSRQNKPEWATPVVWARFINGDYLHKSGFWREEACVEESVEDE